MLKTVHILSIIVTLFYAITFFVYLLGFIHGKTKTHLYNSKRIFLFFTLIVHTFYLIERSFVFDHLPITNQFEIFTILAFAIGFTYFLLELLTDIRGTGVFILVFALIFQVISALFIKDEYIVKEVLKNYPLGIHVINALLGFAGISVSAAYSIMYLLQYKNLQTHKYYLIFDRLPNLEILEKLSYYSMIIGFVLLTIAIAIGFIWLPSAFPDFKFYDPKIISTAIVWLIFGTGILLHIMGRLYGKKISYFSITGFIVAVLSVALSGVIYSSFHDFVK